MTAAGAGWLGGLTLRKSLAAGWLGGLALRKNLPLASNAATYYNVSMKGPVTVIGGANMDINGFSEKPLNAQDSNPGRVEYCPGGVGRNIAENLLRLGVDVRFIGVIGNDPGGAFITRSSERLGLNIEHSLFLAGGPVTSVYIAIMDSSGEMKLALADMAIMDEMTEAHLEAKAGLINESAVVVLDCNLSERCIAFAAGLAGGGVRPRLFLDAVSARKAPRAAASLGAVDTLKVGLAEAAALTGLNLTSDAEARRNQRMLEELSWLLLERGVGRVYITLGKEGVYAACGGDAPSHAFYPAKAERPVNTSGAGDAFMAGLVYSSLEGWHEKRTAQFSLAMASLTVQSSSTVSPEMCVEAVEQRMREQAGAMSNYE